MAVLLGIVLLCACRSIDELEQSRFVSGDYAYVALDRQLHVVEIARPDRPRWVATVDLPGRIKRVQVKGRYAYVVHFPSVDSWQGSPPDGGVQILDLSNPRRPKIVGNYHTPSLAQDIAIADRVAYVADWDGLRIVDIVDPTAPVEITTLTDGMNAVAVDGHTLVGVWGNCSFRTGHCDGGFWAADISSPAAPQELGTVRLDQIPGYAVAVAGDRAYVAGKGLWQVDLSNRAAPTAGSVYELLEGRYQSHLALTGSHALLASDRGLRIVDITVPDKLSEAAFLPMTAFIGDVALRGDTLYTVSNEGLHVIDVHDPVNPIVIGYYSGVR